MCQCPWWWWEKLEESVKWEKAGSSRVINKQSRRRLISMKMNEPSLKWTSSDQFHRQLKMCKNLIDDSQLEMSLRRIAFRFCAYFYWPICIFMNIFDFSDTSKPCETCKSSETRNLVVGANPVISHGGFEVWGCVFDEPKSATIWLATILWRLWRRADAEREIALKILATSAWRRLLFHGGLHTQNKMNN